MTQNPRRYRLSTVVLSSALAAALAWGVTALAITGSAGGTEAAPGVGPTAPTSEIQTSEDPNSVKIPDLSRRIEGDPLAIGRVDAKVVMIEYADYRCPFCSLYARETLPKLVDKYVADGTLRVEWRDLPIFGEQSEAAALAARAAGDQGRFWEFQEALHAAAPDNGHPDLTRDVLLGFARTAGVSDMAAFEVAMDSEAHRAAMQADVREAQALGASSTPVFIIGDEPIAGAQPYEVFAKIIEAQAAK